MAPWLIVFGLSAFGIFLNLAGILLMLVVSIALYIALGSRLRSLSQDPSVMEKLKAFQQSQQAASTSSDTQPTPPDLSPPEAASTPTTSSEANMEPASADPITPSSSTGNRLPKQTEPVVVSIPPEELTVMKGLFGIDTFFCTDTVPYQQGAIFKGNLRGEAGTVQQQLSEKLNQALGDRYRLFLVRDPQEKPVVIILPKSAEPKPTTVVQTLVAVLMAIATVVTCMETTGILLGFDLFSDWQQFTQTLPITSGLVMILAGHELGHRLLANRHKIRLSPPFFIPTWQIGSFGALTRFESLLPNRNVLFDIALAGPAIGGLISLGFIVLGLLLSNPNSLFELPTDFFQGSILVGLLARVVLGSQLQASIVHIHPLALVGWLGLVITALNLMPAGQLDGGRMVHAIYGRKVAQRTTLATLIVLGLAALINPLALYWGIVILFLQRDLERPSLDEISEPDDARAAFALLALFLMAATLLPLTPSLAGRLGIGG
jgi:membrane-associated protease RseP (regulator of RpoE activity)